MYFLFLIFIANKWIEQEWIISNKYDVNGSVDGNECVRSFIINGQNFQAFLTTA